MGATAKTLGRITALVESGVVPAGGNICDIGETQLFGSDIVPASLQFLSFFADRTAKAKAPDSLTTSDAAKLGDGKLLGDLLVLAGFQYTALDIFPGHRTTLFDLNVHEPGPALVEGFDLVLNLGTTEHVFNQLRAFQTLHSLQKIGAVCYHDLPLAGYPLHALYRYDPLFFEIVSEANKYDLVLRAITTGPAYPMPHKLKDIGFNISHLTDVGIECVLRRTSSEEFKIPMEMGTSTTVSDALEHFVPNTSASFPQGTTINYGAALYNVSLRTLTKVWINKVLRVAKDRIAVLRPTATQL